MYNNCFHAFVGKGMLRCMQHNGRDILRSFNLLFVGKFRLISFIGKFRTCFVVGKLKILYQVLIIPL